MEWAIGIVLVLITALLISLILRKRVYDTVDRLELWKMDIMNRNTASQLAKMKNLNLSGEALEKFESWKSRWEFILSKELPDIEDYLFKAEELADRYRFPSAHKILNQTTETLKKIEENIENMLQELDRLLLSEKESREKIAALRPNLDEMKKKLLHHHYQFGSGVQYFEETIHTYEDKLLTYDQLIEEGDYTKARSLASELEEKINHLEDEMQKFPSILKRSSTTIPNQLDDLRSGIKEMIQDGYRIEQLNLEADIRTYEERVNDCIELLNKGNIEDVSIILDDLEERIQEVYDLLEKEAIAKNYVETNIHSYEQALFELGNSFDETRLSVEELRKTYYFEDRDMESFLILEKSIQQSKQQLDELSENIQSKGKSHSELRERLEAGFKQLEELKEKHDQFKEQINNLRKDELKAKEKLQSMNRQISDLQRQLKRSNIPGVPRYIWDMIEKSMLANQSVLQALEKIPLDMQEVYHMLQEAEKALESACEQVERMLQQAHLTEQVIQYANRYRSSYPFLAAQLSEAEYLFRSFEYELSLEKAASAIEEIEPGALKMIEENQKAL